MDRREMLTAVGIGAAGLAALGGRRAVAAFDDHDHHKHDDHLAVIGECAKICNEAAHHCLERICEGEGDAEYHAKAAHMTVDCQAFCVTAATLMARRSPLSLYAHQACADACRDCAEVCAESDETIMKECAEICRKCEQECRDMIAQIREGHHH